MVFKWIKKYLPKKEGVLNHSSLQNIKKYLIHPNIWNLNCQSIARGVGIGLFSAMMPFPQMFLASILIIIFRGNLPIAILLTWISNPFTFLPINYLIYKTGALITGAKPKLDLFQNVNWEWNNIHSMWTAAKLTITELGGTYFIGLAIVALGVGLIGFLIIALFCYIHKVLNKAN